MMERSIFLFFLLVIGSNGMNCTTKPRELIPDDFSVDFTTGLPRDTVVLFYRATCPYCQAFQPIFQCVAEFFKLDSDIDIVQYGFQYFIE